MKSIKFLFLSLVCCLQLQADGESSYARTVVGDNSIAGVAGSIVPAEVVKKEHKLALDTVKESHLHPNNQSVVSQSDTQSLVVRRNAPQRFELSVLTQMPVKMLRKGDELVVTAKHSLITKGKSTSKELYIVDGIEAKDTKDIVRLIDKNSVVETFKRVLTLEVPLKGNAQIVSDNYEVSNWLDMQTVSAGTEIVKVIERERNGKTIFDKTSYILESMDTSAGDVEIALAQKGTPSWYGRRLLTVKFNANRLGTPQCSTAYTYYESIKLSAATLATFAGIALLSVFGAK